MRVLVRAWAVFALATSLACAPSGGDAGDAGNAGDAGDAHASIDGAVPEAGLGACTTDATPLANRQFGANSAMVWGLATDVVGDIVIAGDFQGTIDFGGGPLISSGLQGMFLAKFDSSGAHVFSFGWSSTAVNGLSSGRSVAIDGKGNIVLVGSTDGADLGGGPLPSGTFVAKFASNGELLWSRGYAGPGIQIATAVSVDASGNVIFTGTFAGSVDFGGGPIPNTTYDTSVAIVRLDPLGNYLSSRAFTPSKDGSGAAIAIAARATGEVVLAGSFKGTMDFGTGPTTAIGSTDGFVVLLDANNQTKWRRSYGGGGYDQAVTVAFDANGGIVFAGAFEPSVDFGGPLPTSTAGDGALVALDATGAYRWNKRFGDNDAVESVAIDALDRIVFTGWFEGSADFGGGVLTSSGGSDVFVAAAGDDGTYVYGARFGDEKDQYGLVVAIGASCRRIVSGQLNGTIDVGQGPLASSAPQSLFVVALSP